MYQCVLSSVDPRLQLCMAALRGCAVQPANRSLQSAGPYCVPRQQFTTCKLYTMDARRGAKRFRALSGRMAIDDEQRNSAKQVWASPAWCRCYQKLQPEAKFLPKVPLLPPAKCGLVL